MNTQLNTKQIPSRKDIPKEYRWNLEKMYEHDDLWEKDLKEVEEKIQKMSEFCGTLDQSPQQLTKVLKLKDDIELHFENIYVYARMRKDEDNTVTKYQAMADKAQTLAVKLQSSLSFLEPEITKMPEDKIKKFLKEDEELKEYTFYLKELLRQKNHILSDKEEQLLAQVGELAQAPKNVFGMINNADIKFPMILDEEGKEVEVTKGRYVKFMESKDRGVRKDAFKALYSSYEKQKNTIGMTFNASVKKDVFYARVRKYGSALEKSLDQDHIPLDVYDHLIEAVEEHLPAMYRYVQLRKKALGVDELHMYDLYTPMVQDVEMKKTFEEAKEMVKEGLNPLGEEYVKILDSGFSNRWVDVYENQGKTSGAYSFGSYSSDPYVLMNYQGTINDVFTLAHEMGHSLHSYYSHQTQPYVYGSYAIFVAEVASTVNEALLMAHLLENTKDKKQKMYLLNHYLEQFKGTVYRQTMFAKFEKIVHEEVEKGNALTVDELCKIYKELNKKYYGDDLYIDSEIEMEWARIPHFYNAFYVYKYATGYSAAIALSQRILKEGKSAVEDYINFLKGGGSKYPIDLLKGAGVDMTTEKPIHNALKVFESLVDEMEELMQ